MKNPRSKEEITVDGIRYNVAKGRVLEDQNLSSHARGFDGIRKQVPNQPQSAAVQERQQRSQMQLNPSAVIDLPKRRRRPKRSSKQIIVIDPTSPSFGSYFFKALLPGGFSAAAWIFSVLRGITSPLAWFLVVLPLVILQTQNLANENINQLLERAHQLTQNGLVFHATGVIIFSVALLAVVIFVRFIGNAIALHLRIALLAGQPARLWPATRLVFHNSLKMLFHGSLQIVLLILVGLTAVIAIFWSVFIPHGHTVAIFAPYIVGLILFVWFAILCLLRAKHWLQTAILSSSHKTTEVQRRSWQGVTSYPVRAGLIAALSFVLSVSVIGYGVWVALKSIEWLNRSIVPSNTRFILLMTSIFLAVVMVGYLQQTLWGAYASWLNTQYTPALFVIAKEREIKKAPLWPIWVSAYLFVMILSLVALGIIFLSPRVNSWAVEISSKIPARFEIPRVNRQ